MCNNFAVADLHITARHLKWACDVICMVHVKVTGTARLGVKV